jgi:hypothetical protein
MTAKAIKAFQFSMGDRVKDKVTQFSGIVTGSADHVSGCDTYGVQAQELKDGLPTDAKWFDEPRLELVEAGAIPLIDPREDRTGADGVPGSTRSVPSR